VVAGALITEKKGGKELARNIFTTFIPLFENAAEHGALFSPFYGAAGFLIFINKS